MSTNGTTITLHSLRTLLLTACVAAAPLLASVDANAQAETSRKICRLLPGAAFAYPADWTVGTLESNIRIRPAGAGADEIYAIGLQDLPQGVELESPSLPTLVDGEMARYFPLLKRHAAPNRFKTECGPALSFGYQGAGRDGREYGGAIFLTLLHGHGAALIAIAPMGRLAERLRPMFNVFGSLTPTAEPAQTVGGLATDDSPLAREWSARFSGKKLVYLSSYSSGSGGGYSSQREYRLSRDGRYSFSSSSSVSIYVGGANGGSNGQHAGQGAWRIRTANGAAFLELTQNGQTSRLALSYRGGKTFINGSRYFVLDL
jgi:hypothetical protein